MIQTRRSPGPAAMGCQNVCGPTTTPRQTRSVPQPILPEGWSTSGFSRPPCGAAPGSGALQACSGLLIGSALYREYPPPNTPPPRSCWSTTLPKTPSRSTDRREPGAKPGGGGTRGPGTETAAVRRQLPGRLHGHESSPTTVLTLNVGAPSSAACGAASIGLGHGLSPVPCPVRADPGAAAVRPARSAVQRGPAAPQVA